MKFIGILFSVTVLCLFGCDSEKSPSDKATDTTSHGSRTYFLWVEDAASAKSDPLPALSKADVSVVTLLPVPKKSTAKQASTTAGGKSDIPPSSQPFTELAIGVNKLTRLESGLYRLRLSEPPQADGVIRIKTGNTVLETLMLSNGSEKRPLRVDSLSTAAVKMFLTQVAAQRGFNGVDTEQVNTLLSVVRKHLETLDVPDKLSIDKRIEWYAEQAQKACTLRIGGLSSSAECAAFTLGGEVKGLVGGQVQVVVNQGEPLLITQNGPFMFPVGLINRAHYEVTVKEQPDRQTCTVKYGVGRIQGDNVDSLILQCEENRYPVAGIAEGVTGPVKLRLNGNLETLTLRKDGVFQFTKMLKHGEPYEITLAQQPQELTCALSRGAGYITDNVSDIAINCEPLLFQVGGVANGLEGNLRLRINDTEEITVSQAGEFAFATDFVHKDSYHVQIAEQPPGQTCQLSKGQGRLALSDIKNVLIDCVTNTHRLGGKIEGLKAPLTLTLNGEESLTLTGPGEFHFKMPVVHGSAYKVEVTAQPKGQQCQLKQAEGTVAGEVVDVLVQCAAVQYKLGGMVSGLSGAFQLMLNNRQEILAIPGNGPFEFATRLVSGQRYNVILDTQPSGQVCRVTHGVGRMGVKDIRNVTIECDFQSFKLGGMVSGLKGALKLALNGGKETLPLTSNGMFAFSSAMQTGESYNVSVAVQPVGQQCEVRKGQGSINAANIVDVKVICVPQQPGAKPASGGANVAPIPSASPAESTESTTPAEDGPQTFAAPFPQVIKP